MPEPQEGMKILHPHLSLHTYSLPDSLCSLKPTPQCQNSNRSLPSSGIRCPTPSVTLCLHLLFTLSQFLVSPSLSFCLSLSSDISKTLSQIFRDIRRGERQREIALGRGSEMHFKNFSVYLVKNKDILLYNYNKIIKITGIKLLSRTKPILRFDSYLSKDFQSK